MYLKKNNNYLRKKRKWRKSRVKRRKMNSLLKEIMKRTKINKETLQTIQKRVA